MAEIFGAVAAGIAVCHDLSRLANTIRKAVKTVQTARKDIADLLDETIIFTGLYGAFLQSCEEDTKICRETVLSIERLKTWAQRTIRSFQKLLTGVDALRLDKNYRYSLSQTMKAQVKWLFSTSTVKLLHASLGVARQSVDGFSNLMCLEKLKEELDMLRNTLANASERRAAEWKIGMRLEHKIQSLEQLVDVRQTAHLANTRRLKETVIEVDRLQTKGSTIENTAAATELLEVAEALDTYAREVLPSRLSSHRNHSSVSSGSSSTSRGASERPSGTTRPNSSSSSISSSPIRTHFDAPSTASSFVRASVALNQSAPGPRQARPVRIPIRPEAMQTTANNTYGESQDGQQPHPVNRSDDASQHSLRTNQFPRRATKIGRHMISLTTQKFRINTHHLQVSDYAAANSFFDDLLKHKDKLDQLERALTERDPEGEWLGIPGWRVHLNGINAQAEGPNIRDV